MNDHKIHFEPDGTVKTLYTDAIPLQELGTLEVKRASTIEFNDKTQKWEVLIDGKVMFSAMARHSCLAWEHDHFNG